MKLISRTLTIAAVLLCSSVAMAAGVADDITVKDPYVRAVPVGQPNSAAFMMLMNNSSSDHAVVAGHSDVAKKVELHTHIHEDGVMKMRQIPKIDLKADGHATLKPGGLHVMLMGLKQELKEGETVTLDLEFDDGSRKTIEAPVRSVAGGMNMKEGGMKH